MSDTNPSQPNPEYAALAAMPSAPTKPMSTGKKVGWIIAGVVLFGVVISSVSDDDTGSSYSPSGYSDSSDSNDAQAEIAWGTISQTDKDNICNAYRVSPAETKVIMLDTDGFTPDLADSTMAILAREC